MAEMITRQITVHEGEYLGPVDWSFDFEGFSSTINPQCVKQATDMLHELKIGDLATTDGGWPRVGWNKVIQIGMYDGWPFWKPVPSVCLLGPLGPEWHPWYSLTGVERAARTQEPA